MILNWRNILFLYSMLLFICYLFDLMPRKSHLLSKWQRDRGWKRFGSIQECIALKASNYMQTACRSQISHEYPFRLCYLNTRFQVARLAAPRESFCHRLSDCVHFLGTNELRQLDNFWGGQFFFFFFTNQRF